MDLKPCVTSEMNPPLNSILVDTVEGLSAVSAFLSTLKEFGLDIETNVVPTFSERRIRTIQVGNRERQYVIDMLALAGSPDDLLRGMGGYHPAAWAKPVIDCLRPFLESWDYLKVGHNLGFEYQTLKYNLGMRIRCLYDTYLAEKVIYAGQVHFSSSNFWALDDLTARYCRLAISKDEQKTFDLHSPLTLSQIEYGGLDTRLPLSIKSAQQLHITKGKLQRVIDIENNAIPAFEDMHLAGLLISEERWMGAFNATLDLHKQNMASMDQLFLPVVGKKCMPRSPEDMKKLETEWRETTDKTVRAECRVRYNTASKANTAYRKKMVKFEGESSVQFGSPVQLLAALRTAGFSAKDLKSTNDEQLERLAGDPIIDSLRAFRTTEKIINNYGTAYLEKYVDKQTGRVHSRIDQLGAATGRTTSTKPNVQNINKESDWRTCFVARLGYSIITVDYNGCELRILAEVSGERIWIDAFNKGWDVHSVGAEIIFGDEWKNSALGDCAYYQKDHKKCKCPTHKILRDQIKAINFGIAYGMEAKKLGRSLHISQAKAQSLLDAWRKAFPAVTAWLTQVAATTLLNLQSRTLSGRRRLFQKPDWEVAKKIALERAVEDAKTTGKPQRIVDSRQVASAYRSMNGSIEREGKNTPIQGTNADMVKVAVGSASGYLWERLEPEFGAFLVNIVHDELVVECPTDAVEECYHFIGDCMMRAGAEFMSSVVSEYEGNIAPFWSKG